MNFDTYDYLHHALEGTGTHHTYIVVHGLDTLQAHITKIKATRIESVNLVLSAVLLALG
jgi:hypothetical protein